MWAKASVSRLARHGMGWRRSSGVTIIELLIVILIAGVLAMVAAPSLQSVVRTTRLNSATGLLISDFNLARGEAIKRNNRMLVCARNADGTLCDSDWSKGWVVCLEGAVALQCAAATATTPNPIAVRPPLDASLQLTASNPLAASVPVIRFSPNSAQSTETVPGTRDGNITLVLQGSWDSAATRTVAVALTGNISRQ